MCVKSGTFLWEHAGVHAHGTENTIDMYYLWAFWTSQRQSLPISASTIRGFRAWQPLPLLVLSSCSLAQKSLRVALLKKISTAALRCPVQSLYAEQYALWWGYQNTPDPQTVQTSVNSKHPFSFLNPGVYFMTNHAQTKHISKAMVKWKQNSSSFFLKETKVVEQSFMRLLWQNNWITKKVKNGT